MHKGGQQSDHEKFKTLKGYRDLFSWVLLSVAWHAQSVLINEENQHLLTVTIVDLFNHKHYGDLKYSEIKANTDAIVESPWALILSNFLGGSRIFSSESEQEKTIHHQTSYLRAPFYILHNAMKTPLALTLSLEILLRSITLSLWKNKKTNGDWYVKMKFASLIKCASLLISVVYLPIRIVNTVASLIIEPIAISQRAWRHHPVLGVVSALLSTAIYAAAPILLCKFAPVVFSTVIAKISTAPLMHNLATVKTLVKCAATSAICVVPFLLRGLVSIFKYRQRANKNRLSTSQLSASNS